MEMRWTVRSEFQSGCFEHGEDEDEDEENPRFRHKRSSSSAWCSGTSSSWPACRMRICNGEGEGGESLDACDEAATSRRRAAGASQWLRRNGAR